MKLHRNTSVLGIYLLLLTLFSRCDVLHNDQSQCDLFLKFRYDYNLSFEDQFAEQVKEVKVFVFDTEGKYVQTFSEATPALNTTGYRMPIPYLMKGYKAVVWAGKTDKIYLLPKLIIGDPMDKLTLQYEATQGISDRQIEPLWHSGPVEMTFAEEGNSVQTISLLRNTNDLNVSVGSSDTEAQLITDFDIRLKAANGAYTHHNVFPNDIPEITYTPAKYSEQQTAHLYTLRMVKGNALQFSVTNRISGTPILFEGKETVDLIDLLLKMKSESNNNEMDDQEYLDRKYIWDLSLNYESGSHAAISITVNNWTYWFHNTDLG